MDRHGAALLPVKKRVYSRAISIIALASLSALPLPSVATSPAATTRLSSEPTDTTTAGSFKEIQLAQNQQGTSFDHLKTGFPLIGAHRSVKCESCHVRGIFKGTPRVCSGCHSRASHIATTVKPANHIPSGPECDLCHTPTVWSTARFNHSTLGFNGTPSECLRCHNGQTATGKPGNHIPTTAACDSCHSTRAWRPATFDHSTVAPGACATCHNGGQATGKPGNHLPTTASCDSCHTTRAWQPATFDHSTVTPSTCATCHNGIIATGKAANHIATTASCDLCHRTIAWLPATFDHSTVPPGTCATCHNGTTSTGKPGNHIPTTASCDSCHSTRAWTPATAFDHTGVAPGTCGTCHNGTQATGKPATHVPTTAACDSCHTTTAWKPATFDHSAVTPGTCGTCHNGTQATGKSATHIPTTASCDSCHTTTAWKPAAFNHSTVAPGTCATCHNGTTATGKSSGHFVTTRSCDACHNTTNWLSILNYSHTSPFFPSGHRPSVTCASCHTTNSEVINWKFPAYKPDCAGCHADDYRPGAHGNATVSELRDCSGPCHNRSGGHHRTSQSSWD